MQPVKPIRLKGFFLGASNASLSLCGAHTENLLALGADAALIGVSRHDDHLPAARRKPVFSYHDGLERFLAAGPEIDVYMAQRGTMNPVTVAQIKAEPGFKVIHAVRDERICLVDEVLVARPTRRLLAGIDQIGLCLYPEIFETGGLRVLDRAGLIRSPARVPGHNPRRNAP